MEEVAAKSPVSKTKSAVKTKPPVVKTKSLKADAKLLGKEKVRGGKTPVAKEQKASGAEVCACPTIRMSECQNVRPKSRSPPHATPLPPIASLAPRLIPGRCTFLPALTLSTARAVHPCLEV